MSGSPTLFVLPDVPQPGHASEEGAWVVVVAFRRDELYAELLDDEAGGSECYTGCTMADAAKVAADTADPGGYNWSPGSNAYAMVAPEAGGPLHLVTMRMRAGEHGTGDAKVLRTKVIGAWKPA